MDMTTSDGITSPASPDEKVERGLWSKIITMTPIVLTIVATAFAGISSSEMTRSMYFRSLAAQQQSKAGDQWSFFQVKRIRGTTLESTVDLMQSLGSVELLTQEDLEPLFSQLEQLLIKMEEKKSAEGIAVRLKQLREVKTKMNALFADEATKSSLKTFFGGSFPKIEPKRLEPEATAKQIDEVTKAIGQRKTERETASIVGPIKMHDIEEATRIAEENADTFDKACEPISDVGKKLRGLANDLTRAFKNLASEARKDSTNPEIKPILDRLNLGLRMAVTDYDARRYRQESTYNRLVAEMYEVRVRRSGVESDRHAKRSELFFYCMILAQAGVTIASLAMARKHKSVFWSFASVAGILSIAGAGYVFLSH